jgi:hypothetical protein
VNQKTNPILARVEVLMPREYGTQMKASAAKKYLTPSITVYPCHGISSALEKQENFFAAQAPLWQNEFPTDIRLSGLAGVF